MKIKHEPELTIIDTIEGDEDEEVIENPFQQGGSIKRMRRRARTIKDFSEVFSCDLCPKKYAWRQSINRHVLLAHSSQPRSSKISLIIFIWVILLERILGSYHARNYTPTVSVPGFCELCQKEVRSMKYHRETFHSNVYHCCDICDFSTKYYGNLLSHKNRVNFFLISKIARF